MIRRILAAAIVTFISVSVGWGQTVPVVGANPRVAGSNQQTNAWSSTASVTIGTQGGGWYGGGISNGCQNALGLWNPAITVQDFPNLSGNYSIGFYGSYYQTFPAVNNYNGLSFPGMTVSEAGGLEMGMTYTPIGNDPTGVNFGWIQFISSNNLNTLVNSGIPRAQISGPDQNGLYWALDNGGNNTTPFSNQAGGNANSTTLLDIPFTQTSLTQNTFYTFKGWWTDSNGNVAAGNVNNTIKICQNGVFWGYATNNLGVTGGN